MISAVEQVTGEPLVREQRGTIADLRTAVAGAANPWAAIGEWYNLSMLATPPFAVLANERYPELRITTLGDYLHTTLADRVVTS